MTSSTTNNSCGTGTATCTPTTCGTTCNVNDITTPGCYTCDWNGALLRVGDGCFTTNGTTTFDFTCNDVLTVTFLTDDTNATTEECRTYANSVNARCSF